MTPIAAYILIHHDLNESTSSSLSRSARGAAICMREARFTPRELWRVRLSEGLRLGRASYRTLFGCRQRAESDDSDLSSLEGAVDLFEHDLDHSFRPCHPDPPSFCDLNDGLLNEFRELTMSGSALQRDTNHGPNEHDTRFSESRAVGVGHNAFFRYACEASGCEELGLRTVSKDEPRAVCEFDGSWKQNPKSGVRNFCVTSSQRGFAADIHEPEACLACNYTQLSAGGKDA